MLIVVTNIRFYIFKRFSYLQIVIFENYIKKVLHGFIKNNSYNCYYLLRSQVF